MTDTNQLHNESMVRAEMGLLARMRKAHAESEKLFRESLDLELRAIETMGEEDLEPTYSILHRSAATLALDCNDPRLAERLIGRALAHEPPAELAEELRDLLEQVNFRRHLQLRGIALTEDELQMSLAGPAVGVGLINRDELLERIDAASKLIYRTVERGLKRPFRERGRPPQVIKDDYELFLSLPRAGSYAITLKLGRPTAQLKLLGIPDTSDIVKEFMDLMSLLNRAEFEELEARIPDVAYRTNFVQLARRIAPDGQNVRIVGFTSVQRGEERFVEVTRPKADIVPPQKPGPGTLEPSERVTIRGVLRFADATHRDRREIKIVDEETQKIHQVKVPEGMMNDIVKPLWDSPVVVKGTREGEYIVLEDIEEQ